MIEDTDISLHYDTIRNKRKICLGSFTLSENYDNNKTISEKLDNLLKTEKIVSEDNVKKK